MNEYEKEELRKKESYLKIKNLYQPYYEEELTEEDCREIKDNIYKLAKLLFKWKKAEDEEKGITEHIYDIFY